LLFFQIHNVLFLDGLDNYFIQISYTENTSALGLIKQKKIAYKS